VERISDIGLSAQYNYLSTKKSPSVLKMLSNICPMRHRLGKRVMYLSYIPGGRLLDVGCGNGHFLALMRQLGWETTGLEVDREAATVARRTFGLDVLCSSLADAKFPTDHFDAITLRHVIEHLPDPAFCLNECRRILKPMGRLSVITPNVASLGHKLFKAAWRGLEVPRHFVLFTPSTLSQCVAGANLCIERTFTSASYARGMFQESSIIRRRDKQQRTSIGLALRIRAALFQVAEIAQLTVDPNVGEEIVLIARK
jgi:2-polyprenyl-3-methyl-5-hydroxy-6-metoxy-1,4-benzoquinol methylase